MNACGVYSCRRETNLGNEATDLALGDGLCRHSRRSLRAGLYLGGRRAALLDTSVYSGSGRNIEAHFVLRLTADPMSLFSLINEIYDLSLEARVLISTMTYVVIEKLSHLSLRDACLLTVVQGSTKIYRNNHFLPFLVSDQNRKRAKYPPEDAQVILLRYFKQLETAIDSLGDAKWLEMFKDNIRQKFATGLLLNDFVTLRDPHDILQGRVEDTLLKITSEKISEEDLESWRTDLNIKPGKTIRRMTMYERIALINRAVQRGTIAPEMAEDANLPERTVSVRNDLTHNRREELNNDRYVEAIAIYCKFLSTWDKEDERPA